MAIFGKLICATTIIRNHKPLTRLVQDPKKYYSRNNQPESILSYFERVWESGKVPEQFNFARDVFDKNVKRRPSSLALWVDDNQGNERKWSYTEMKGESIRTAEFLREHLTSGTSTFVMTVLGRVPEWWFFHLGCIRAGHIFCPGTTQLTSRDITYRLEASGAGMIVTDESNVERVDEAVGALRDLKVKNQLKKVVVSSKVKWFPKDWIVFNSEANKNVREDLFENANTKSDDIAACFFTSGSTGHPKLVGHTHASTGFGNYTTVKSNCIGRGDVAMNLSDTGWAKASFTSLFAPWSVGACSYINQMKISDASQILKVLRTKPVTNFCVPPTMYKCMIQETDKSSFKFKSLRVCSGGGEPIVAEVSRVWKQKTGLDIHQVYGQSEMTPILCFDSVRFGSLGVPNRMCNDIRIVDDNQQECPPGVPGHIAVNIKSRPLGLFAGYLKQTKNGLKVDVEKTSKVFIGDYYITGDIGYTNESGHLFYYGRADDIISSAGYRIGPSEIEAALQTHPAVAESAAVPSPDPLRGEVVKAFIVLSQEYKHLAEEDVASLKKSIQDHVKAETAPYKYPRKVEFVNSLPKTLTGKILRRVLKQRELDDNFLSDNANPDEKSHVAVAAASSSSG